MSTTQPSITFSNISDASFRAWIQAIKDGLTNNGITYVADTGAIDLTTVTTPNGGNQNKGFLIFRFNDALQTGSTTVYIKFEFGSGTAATNPAMTFQCGTGTDGSGTLTNPGQKFATMFSSNSSSAKTCYFSGASDRFVFSIFHSTASQGQTYFCERLKNSDGTNSSEGFAYGCMGVLMSGGWATGTVGVQCHEFQVSCPPAITDSLGGSHFVAGGATTTQWGNNVALIPIMPVGSKIFNPIQQVWIYLNADITSLSVISATVYGTSRSMIAMGDVNVAGYYLFQNSNAKPLIANY
jgi:hypothetical protein